MWRAPNTTSNLHVADGGIALVEFYPGANLLDAQAGPTTPVLRFHRMGLPPVTIRLAQVVARPGALPRTISHRHWARSYGFAGRNFVLETTEGRRFSFDPASGRAVSGRLIR